MTNENVVKTPTLGEKVSKFKNISIEENVDMFEVKVRYIWEREIRIRTNKLKSIEEDFNNSMIDHNQELEEHRQAYFNSFLDINEGDISTVDKRSAYVSKYEKQINTALSMYEDYKKSIELFKQRYADEVNLQLDKINFYKSCLNFGE